jgi:hypothetical protein
MAIDPNLLADALEEHDRPRLSPPEVELVVRALRAYAPRRKIVADEDNSSTGDKQ